MIFSLGKVNTWKIKKKADGNGTGSIPTYNALRYLRTIKFFLEIAMKETEVEGKGSVCNLEGQGRKRIRKI
tara:strand:- start:149 stop:361 length:213 start_codon:yes stop_codon:yes gene_type:complete